VNDQIPEGWQSYKGFAIRPGVAPYSKGSYMKKTKKEKEIPQINLWYLDKINNKAYIRRYIDKLLCMM